MNNAETRQFPGDHIDNQQRGATGQSTCIAPPKGPLMPCQKDRPRKRGIVLQLVRKSPPSPAILCPARPYCPQNPSITLHLTALSYQSIPLHTLELNDMYDCHDFGHHPSVGFGKVEDENQDDREDGEPRMPAAWRFLITEISRTRFLPGAGECEEGTHRKRCRTGRNLSPRSAAGSGAAVARGENVGSATVGANCSARQINGGSGTRRLPAQLLIDASDDNRDDDDRLLRYQHSPSATEALETPQSASQLQQSEWGTLTSQWNINSVNFSTRATHETRENHPPPPGSPCNTSHKRKFDATYEHCEATRDVLSGHRTIQSSCRVHDEDSLFASFRLDATCAQDEAPRRPPMHGVLPLVYQDHFSRRAQDVAHNMNILSPSVPHPDLHFSLPSTGDFSHNSSTVHWQPPSNERERDDDQSPPNYEELQDYAGDKRNLILDATHPFVPHIVISPPDCPDDGYWAYVQNGVGPQFDERSLTVPPVSSGSSFIWPPWQDRHYIWHAAQYPRHPMSDTPRLPAVPPLSHGLEEPKPVFSRFQFEGTIEAASHERLVMYHVVPSLHRIHLKAAAMVAGMVAPGFRSRWDDPSFVDTFERPFRWTDEAEPLLAAYNCDPQSIVIDSTHPCLMPHIVITQAPPQDPWEVTMNQAVNPQDCGFGYYLTVPSSAVDYINTIPPHASYLYDSPPASPNDIDESESLSDDDSLMLLTPPDQPAELDDVDITDSDETICAPTSYSSDPCDYQSCSDIDMDDEDDGLPPFDDWYLGIAQRASLPLPPT